MVGDAVYKYDELQMFLEEQQKSYLVAVPTTHTMRVQGRQQLVEYWPRSYRRGSGRALGG